MNLKHKYRIVWSLSKSRSLTQNEKLNSIVSLFSKSSSAAVRTRRRHRRTGLLLVRTAAEDDFVICRNARMDMCLCYQVDV